MDSQPRSLRALFTTAENQRHALDNLSSTISSTYQENLASAITSYEESLKIANEVSLFSPNETLEDINSGDLQYLLINFHLAELVQKITAGDRKTILRGARTLYERFLKLLDSYDLLGKSDARLYEVYKDAPDTFSTASTTDATARRETKIARFKEEKGLKRKLEYLRQNPTALANDDAALRDLHLTNIHLHLLQTFASLESIALEFQILAQAPSSPPSQTPQHFDSRQRGPSDQPYSERLDNPLRNLNNMQGPILSKDGKPLRPFTLLDKRAEVASGVFRPDHSLPTMTIDEYLAEEKKRGGMIEGGGAASEVRPEPDEDDVEKADVETMKKREWDEFTEANPKGSGNTMNRG